MEEDWLARAKAWRPRRTTFVGERGWQVFSEFKAGITGRKGERAVTRELERLQLPALHDVILADDLGTTQIDHLVLASGSIAVLETKTYAGTITGALDDTEWTQHLRGGEQRYGFLNPLLQNRRHCRAVLAQVGEARLPVVGYVVAAGTATFSEAIAPAIVPIARLGEVLVAYGADASVSPALHDAWNRLRLAAFWGEELRERHDATLRRRGEAL